MTRTTATRAIVFVALFLSASNRPFGQAKPTVGQQKIVLRDHVGETLQVCGAVAATQTDDKGTMRLDIDKPEPNQTVTFVISKVSKFGPGFSERISRGRICAEGKLERSGNYLQIKVEKAASLASEERVVPRPANFGAGAHDLLREPGIVAPRLSAAPPRGVYPDLAKEAERNGSVDLEVLVRADGSIGDARVLRSIDALWGLDEAALVAARQIRFAPGTLAGQPVDVITRVLVSFAKAPVSERPAGEVTLFAGYPLTPEPQDIVKVSETTGLRTILEVKPKYTSDAMRRKIQGAVELDIVVRADGTARVLRITKSLDPFGLDLAAITAAEQWKFEPGKKAGVPVSTRVMLMLEFRLH